MHSNNPDYPEQPAYKPSPSDEQERPKKKVPGWLVILLAALMLFGGGASAYSYLSSILHDPVPGIVNQYYTAIKSQNYATAFQYLGVHEWNPSIKSNPGRGIDNGWGFPGGEDFMTQSDFIQAAQGKVRTFTLSVVCGRGKLHLISGVYPEQFKLRLSLFDGFKMRQNPSSTKYRYDLAERG